MVHRGNKIFIKKKSFLLLELLIGIAILALLVLPFTLSPLRVFKAKKKMLVELEIRRHATLIACEVKEKLYSEQGSFNLISLEPFHPRTKPYMSRLYPIQIPGFGEELFEMKSFLRVKKMKVSKEDQEEHFLMHLVVYFGKPKQAMKRTSPHFTFCFAMTEDRV